VTQYHRRDKA